MEPLGLSSSIAGLLSLGITVCQWLLEYYQSWKDAEHIIARMYALMEALTNTLKLVESPMQHKALNSEVILKIEENIKSTENGIRSLRKKLDKIQLVSLEEGWRNKAKAQFRRILFPFKELTLAEGVGKTILAYERQYVMMTMPSADFTI